MKSKLVLKGGTAINLFLLDIPRLSVDIDLNYIGMIDRNKMLEDRTKMDQAFNAVFSREGFVVKRFPEEHAGGKWRLKYQSFTGQNGNIEVDLNYMFRLPLWEVQKRDSHLLGQYQAKNIPLLDIHELTAGKLAALLARHQVRDLFDCSQIMKEHFIDREKLRLAFVVYGGMNRIDWRTVGWEHLTFDESEFREQLFPIIRNTAMNPIHLGNQLINQCRQILASLFPLTKQEREFLDRLLDKGEIVAELLTDDAELQARIRDQPMLQWKAFHVRQRNTS
ncbi:MAG: nucleotidyl transferase AbiEii/AbiGii toxin family protein [Planctomycetaceae bacterium]|nr:nucleotidyl transferase AbiEii/AbiGii toxin family protein [Planctomycetaceae bacterium]